MFDGLSDADLDLLNHQIARVVDKQAVPAGEERGV
jgi:hypothetical protein